MANDDASTTYKTIIIKLTYKLLKFWRHTNKFIYFYYYYYIIGDGFNFYEFTREYSILCMNIYKGYRTSVWWNKWKFKNRKILPI